jgi:hypothetical protein
MQLLIDPAWQYFPLVTSCPYVTEEGKIPFFGSVVEETRQLDGKTDRFYMLARQWGWAVALVITKEGHVVLNIQPKPGSLCAAIEFPAGGIGKDPQRTEADIVGLTVERVLIETGYDGAASYLGHVIVESGKFFDPAVRETFDGDGRPLEPMSGRGVKAHLVLIRGAEQVEAGRAATTEKLYTFRVSLADFLIILRQGMIKETSAVACAFYGLIEMGYLKSLT